MSELKCNCGRATHTGLGCGPDLPRAPYDRQDELTRLRAEVARLRAALDGLVEKLNEVHADRQYQAVWQCSRLRYGQYTGPTYTEELAKAKAALAGKEREVPDAL